MKALAIIIVFVLVFLTIQDNLIPMFFPPAQQLQTDGAVNMSQQIRQLPQIDTQVCQGAPSLVANVVTVLQDMDGTLGTGFGHIVQFDAQNCDIAIGFIPVLGSYNQLVRDSSTLDPKNATSVKTFYEDLFVLSSDFVMVNDKVAYKAAFESTGDMNDALQLNKLRDLCGDDCYRATLSAIHWSTREELNQYMCEFENWASKSVQLDARFC